MSKVASKVAKVRKRVNRFDEFEKGLLEEKFKANNTPSTENCQEIAKLINDNRKEKSKASEQNGPFFVLTAKQIKFWFDHRRRLQNHGTYKPLRPGSRSTKKAADSSKGSARTSSGAKADYASQRSPAGVSTASPFVGVPRGPILVGQPVASTSAASADAKAVSPQMTNLPAWMQSMTLLPLMSTMVYKTYEPNTVIIKSGDLSDDLYFLLKGSVKVIDYNNNEVAQLGEGMFFGEMGVIDRGPRTATVVTVDHCQVFVMSGEVARDMLQCEPTVSKDVVDQATDRLLALFKVSESCPASKLIGANILKYCVFKKGCVVLREGEYTDDFYFLVQGSVTVTKQGSYISKLDSGSFFGEMGALCSNARTATITCTEDCEVFKLSGEILRMLSKDDDALKNGVGETLRNVVFARAYDTMMALTDNSVRPQTADVAVSNTAMTSDLKMALFQLLKCIHNVSVSV
mmetsp:Transcript_6394/g.21994  ORF Transcript_6394/g.21994 Transcript_6394/m.21994 type:complete len:460 (-) Transcript_6394:99-1478(-)